MAACLLVGAALSGAGHAQEAEQPAPETTAPADLEIPAVSGENNVATAPSLNLASGFAGEHAPLALFSLGSLAVGGVFYGISNSMRGADVAYTARDRSQFTSAVGVAGLTALFAAGAYLYYAHQAAYVAAHVDEKAPAWDAAMTGGVAPDGHVDIGARLTLALPSLSR